MPLHAHSWRPRCRYHWQEWFFSDTGHFFSQYCGHMHSNRVRGRCQCSSRTGPRKRFILFDLQITERVAASGFRVFSTGTSRCAHALLFSDFSASHELEKRGAVRPNEAPHTLVRRSSRVFNTSLSMLSPTPVSRGGGSNPLPKPQTSLRFGEEGGGSGYPLLPTQTSLRFGRVVTPPPLPSPKLV